MGPSSVEDLNDLRCLLHSHCAMSSVYALEPGTRGLLTLRTTHGPISVALWADESPRAGRSVVQHALNSYYDGLAFHRVVPGVLIQGGDPSGTGYGGAPAFPGPLRREAHGRLKFRRRGLVALVADEDGLCGSQFFITLAETPWLNGLHTIVGNVVGDTIFNALALAEAAKDADEPPKILGIDVVDNPFPEIVRNAKEKNAPSIQKREDPLRKVAVRDTHRLSFALPEDDDSEDDGPAPLPKKKSIARVKVMPVVPVPSSKSASASQPLQNGAVDKATEARAEFDRLRAALLRGGVKKSAKPQKNGVASAANAYPPAASTRPATDLAAVKIGGKRNSKRDAISVPRSRRHGKSGSQEAEVLHKLAGFEKKVLAARVSGSKARSENDAARSWFAKPLTLPGAHDERKLEEDADEYEAREGLPQSVHRRRDGHSSRGYWDGR